MRLLHYSAEPLGAIVDAPEQPEAHFKPLGLWVSVEGPDDWPSWCRSEEWGLERLRYAHEISLHPDARILRLSSGADIDAMSRHKTRNPALQGLSCHGLDWRLVAAEYDGIIIAPYNWSRRLDRRAAWYYASGCIWRAQAIERVTLLADAA